MDKVLRYEISLKTEFFSQVYKRKIFRVGSEEFKIKSCPHHKQSKKRFKVFQSYLDSRIKEKNKVTKRDRENWKMYNEWQNRSISMIVGKSKLMERFGRVAGADYNNEIDKYTISKFEYKHTILGGKDVAYFSDRFLQLCVDHFIERVNYYQLNVIEPYDEIIDRINAYNDRAEINAIRFNAMNVHLTLDAFGNQKKKKNGALVKNATEMMKQTELREYNLKKVSVTLLASILVQIHSGKSLHQVFEEFKTPSSTISRIRSDLKMFGVFDQTLKERVSVNVRTDFWQYYWNTESEIYRAKFYTKPEHFNYGQFKIKQRSAKSLKTA